MSTADPDWFDGFFDEDYLRFAVDRYPVEATAAEVDFLVSALDLKPGTRVLDLACGHGRHSVELARYGCSVTGVDLSEPSLALAAARAAGAGVDLRLARADMRRLEFAAEFDVVINMFTASSRWHPEEPSCSRRSTRWRCSRVSRRAGGTSSRTAR